MLRLQVRLSIGLFPPLIEIFPRRYEDDILFFILFFLKICSERQQYQWISRLTYQEKPAAHTLLCLISQGDDLDNSVRPFISVAGEHKGLSMILGTKYRAEISSLAARKNTEIILDKHGPLSTCYTNHFIYLIRSVVRDQKLPKLGVSCQNHARH